jgi:monovalent cation:H+ antiporter-2, CPA2 family
VFTEPLTQVLILLLATVLVVALARRAGMPAVLGYIAVGMLLGPVAGALPDSGMMGSLAEIGVVFLLFTLGLDFSWPRMLAMRREVFGLGLLQLLAVGLVVALAAHWLGLEPMVAVVVGGAVAMSSTAIVLHQLTDQTELNRTHGRLAFAVLLFQDLAFVPLLALASALLQPDHSSSTAEVAVQVAVGLLALVAVLAIGRWLLRPLFYTIAHSRLRELFTLTVLLVVLASAWLTHAVGLSMALGAFLAGMMLAESEYKHQVDAAARPFRELLVGLFFISVGTLLDWRLLYAEFPRIFALLLAIVTVKALVTVLVARLFVDNTFRAVRTAVVVAGAGEFGLALITLLLRRHTVLPPALGQPLLVALVLSMIASPLLIRYNRAIARRLLGERGPPNTDLQREEAFAADLARREHVILCGFGRVGQNIARVLESMGFEFIAIDLDPARIRLARGAGDPVVFGDSADEELLRQVGIDAASAVIVTFANPEVSVGIVRSVRRLRQDVPVLVRTQDDAGLAELTAAGVTEVVPETFEASLMLVSQVLMLLNVPVSKVVRTVTGIRAGRYATLRNLYRHEAAQSVDDTHALREELRTIVLPPQAWGIGRSLREIREDGAEVVFTMIRRNGIAGREPDSSVQLREGDVVTIFGTPEALEHAEAVLLAG